jgi:hypothetical protein
MLASVITCPMLIIPVYSFANMYILQTSRQLGLRIEITQGSERISTKCGSIVPLATRGQNFAR